MNNYRTLKADELHDLITEKKKYKKKIVALTFDGGLRSLWSVAYPILKKYGLNAISFIVPFHPEKLPLPKELIVNVPKTPQEKIVGRLSELNDLHQRLFDKNSLTKLYDYLPFQPLWHVLVTSREQIHKFDLKEPDFLSENEAVTLFISIGWNLIFAQIFLSYPMKSTCSD